MIVDRLAGLGIEHQPIRVLDRQADWTLLITSGEFGDKLPIGFRGCHARARTRIARRARQAAVRPSRRGVASQPGGGTCASHARRWSPVVRTGDAQHARSRCSVSSFAASIDILCCNRIEWETLEDREEVAWQLSILVVTDGPKGSTVRFTTPSRRCRDPPYPSISPRAAAARHQPGGRSLRGDAGQRLARPAMVRRRRRRGGRTDPAGRRAGLGRGGPGTRSGRIWFFQRRGDRRGSPCGAYFLMRHWHAAREFSSPCAKLDRWWLWASAGRIPSTRVRLIRFENESLSQRHILVPIRVWSRQDRRMTRSHWLLMAVGLIAGFLISGRFGLLAQDREATAQPTPAAAPRQGHVEVRQVTPGAAGLDIREPREDPSPGSIKGATLQDAAVMPVSFPLFTDPFGASLASLSTDPQGAGRARPGRARPTKRQAPGCCSARPGRGSPQNWFEAPARPVGPDLPHRRRG